SSRRRHTISDRDWRSDVCSSELSDREERKSEPIEAPMPARPIENGLAGVGLLSWILVQKYCNHLPLYRQQSIFAREGLELPRQTDRKSVRVGKDCSSGCLPNRQT